MNGSPPMVEELLDRARRFRHGQRGWPILLLSAPLAVAAIGGLATGDLPLLAGAGGAWAIVVAAAIGARRGFAAEARGQAPPRGFRLITAGLVGIGTGLAALLAVGHAPVVAALFGVGAAAGVRLLYGAPRAVSEPAADVAAGSISGDAAVLAAARMRLARLEAAASSVRQRDFAAAIRRVVRLGGLIVAEAEADPADLRRARRFLGVYLEGAERVANRYVETHRSLDVSPLEPDFLALLNDLEHAFAAQLANLKANDLQALDVEIEVLQKRLREEGLLERKATG
jgi:hypothetical protein